MKPRYTHNCDSCRFLGKYEEFDLYFCPRCDGGTCLARYGNEQDSYRSAPAVILNYPDYPKDGPLYKAFTIIKQEVK